MRPCAEANLRPFARSAGFAAFSLAHYSRLINPTERFPAASLATRVCSAVRALRLTIMLTSSRSLGSAGATTCAPWIAVRSLPLRVTLAMTLSLAMGDVMDSLCKDDGARDANRECCGGEME